jgi:hypothetical protein
MSNIPDTFDRNGMANLLSPIISKSVETIKRDIYRSPKSLPPYVELGGYGGKKCFVTEQIINFYPPIIGALILHALERIYLNKTSVAPTINLPILRPLAEELKVAAESSGRKP